MEEEMTREEIEKMEAGRELDSLIARKVFGYEITCSVDPLSDFSVGRNRDGSDAKRNFCWVNDDLEIPTPHFSTKIQAAWQVVEKFDKKDNEVYLNHLPRFYPEWQCIIFYMDGNRQSAGADTAPLAICRAALLAVESK
jgi:hypothetical protein